MGLDYGGIFGAQIEFLPIKNVGIFAGGGLNFVEPGWNVGGKFNVSPDKIISTNLLLMYGSNGVIKTDGDERLSYYETVSKGVSIGVIFDFKAGRKNKLNIGLLIPFRDSEFRRKVKEAKDDPNIKLGVIMPIGLSFGYCFGF